MYNATNWNPSSNCINNVNLTENKSHVIHCSIYGTWRIWSMMFTTNIQKNNFKSGTAAACCCQWQILYQMDGVLNATNAQSINWFIHFQNITSHVSVHQTPVETSWRWKDGRWLMILSAADDDDDAGDVRWCTISTFHCSWCWIYTFLFHHIAFFPNWWWSSHA